MELNYKNNVDGGFPGGALVEDPPTNAGDMGSSFGPGRSHMPRSNLMCVPQLLRLRSRAREPQLLKPTCLVLVLCNKKSHRNDKPMHHNEGWPPLDTRESLHAATKAQHSQK